MQAVFDRLSSLLPVSLQRYAKAVQPLLILEGAAIAKWGESGTFDQTEVLLSVGGVLVSLFVAKVPNRA